MQEAPGQWRSNADRGPDHPKPLSTREIYVKRTHAPLAQPSPLTAGDNDPWFPRAPRIPQQPKPRLTVAPDFAAGLSPAGVDALARLEQVLAVAA